MTSLRALLSQRIATSGPISIADYMTECLQHPQHGYYITRDPLGTAGDFTTAPEISQMFGELLGLALAQSWMDQGASDRFALVELGPGRGTLMADILRATKPVAGFHASLDLHLVETSPTLRNAQKNLLGADATWHDTVHSLPTDMPIFLVANEFFDALPIRQFQRAGNGWCERVVGLEADHLTLGLSAATPLAQLEHRLVDTKDGDIVEVAPSLCAITNDLGTRIEANGGAALIVDYGDWGSQGDTLQAIEQHAAADPFANPGHADLTAHVDFEAIARATPSKFSRLTPQGIFLERLGITGRAQQLAAKLEGAALDSHVAAHRRLTHPSEMGTLFKVLGLFSSQATPPAGLEP